MIFQRPPRPPVSSKGDEYRLYFLDGAGRIEQSHEFVAKGDDAAIRISEGWREGRAMELWQFGRLVRSWR
jgi:hypothetical protein